MKVDVVVGGLYGDEGKGKIISKLGQNYEYIFRVNASTNATHTVSINDKVTVTRQLPSVFGNKDAIFVLAPGAILNICALKDELKNRFDVDNLKGKIVIASTISLLIDPYIELNRKNHNAQKLGSTNQGIGNAIRMRASKASLQLVDLYNYDKKVVDKEYIYEKIKYSCNLIDKDFTNSQSDSYFIKEADKLIEAYQEIKKLVGEFVVDYTKYLYNMPKNAKVLIEGCNGVMLDNLHGLTPYTLSYSTSINSLMNGANISPIELNDTYLIITGYFCCLNKRPFLTEMTEEEANKIYKYNSEIDDSENMQRRLGWVDIPTLRKALLGHKKCKLILNKLDIMKDIDTIKVCDYYLDSEGNKIEIMPDNILEYQELKPHYITLPGFKINDKNKLPKELKRYVKYLEKEVDRKIVYLGVGRNDEDLLDINDVTFE